VKKFAPISGAGVAVQGDGWGGWRSSTEGVIYRGSDPRSEYDLDVNGIARGTAVHNGLVPPIQPAWELHLRDGVVTLGGDRNYYLTGSSGDNIWGYTKGVELWKSSNLKTWYYLGLVWDIDRDAEDWVKQWRQHPRRAVRAVWAPEIHYIRGNYFICFSMCPGGIGILKSATGEPQGPYVSAFEHEGPIVDGIDATLFEDEDGKVYFTYGAATKIAMLRDDLSGFADPNQPFTDVTFDDHDLDPTHHAPKCEARGMHDLGHEGAVLFKRGGKYYLGAADNYENRYSTCLAISDHIYGPYIKRHESIPCGGGTGFFQDREGQWWSSYFGNDVQSHFREKTGFVRAEFADDGRVFPAKEQPFVDMAEKADWEEKWSTVWKNKYK
jgi:hypothetical protein